METVGKQALHKLVAQK